MDRVYDKLSREWYYIDGFGNPYFYRHPKDKTERVTITLPVHLLALIDKKRKNDYSRSRYIRGIIEYGFGIEPNLKRFQ